MSASVSVNYDMQGGVATSNQTEVSYDKQAFQEGPNFESDGNMLGHPLCSLSRHEGDAPFRFVPVCNDLFCTQFGRKANYLRPIPMALGVLKGDAGHRLTSFWTARQYQSNVNFFSQL